MVSLVIGTYFFSYAEVYLPPFNNSFLSNVKLFIQACLLNIFHKNKSKIIKYLNRWMFISTLFPSFLNNYTLWLHFDYSKNSFLCVIRIGIKSVVSGIYYKIILKRFILKFSYPGQIIHKSKISSL